jgi:hypothetical protein
LPAEVSINTASFDTPEIFPPRKHIYTESRISWFHTADDLPRHTGSAESIELDARTGMDGIEYYLAYGSNLPYARMLERTSKDLKLKGKFAWTGRRLAFAKRGRDGSGKCTAIEATNDRVVWGAIYQLTPSDKRNLAAVEVGYHEQPLMLPIDGVQRLGFTYLADQEQVDESLRPYHWYKRLVLAGAREHGFPADYIAAIEGSIALDDPNAERCAKEETLLVPLERAARS